MRFHPISHVQLMEESESQIESVARDGAPMQTLIASRLLEDTRLYQRWEAEHSRLMRTVSSALRPTAQVLALRGACFGLIHRKAMFEFLRQHKITGRDRHEVFALVYGDHDYAKAVLTEHGNYVRSACSLFCAHHLGLNVMSDVAFGEPLQRYEQLYAEYFRAFCGTVIGPDRYRTGDTIRTLVPYLKQQLGPMRRAILGLPRDPEFGWHDVDLSEPAANTARMAQPFRAA